MSLFTTPTVSPSAAGSLQSWVSPDPIFSVWGSMVAETQVGVLAEAVEAVSPLRSRCPCATVIWLNRSAPGKVTVVVADGDRGVVVDVLEVLDGLGVAVGFFIGEMFCVEAPARTMATGVAMAANRTRLPEARARRRRRRRASPRRRTSAADGSWVWSVRATNR
jgi:hypothetical protein